MLSALLLQQADARTLSLTGWVWGDLMLVGGLIFVVFALVWFVKRM